MINVHNLHGAMRQGWSMNLIEMCCGSSPTVWTLHDMWSFTGGCAYSIGCTRFIEGCDRSCICPSSSPRPPIDQVAPLWSRKATVVGSCTNLYAVTPSQWLAGRASAGLWKSRPVHVVPNGLRLHDFEPMGRAEARFQLGVEPTRPLVMAAAVDLDEIRKGGSILAGLDAPGRTFDLMVAGHCSWGESAPGIIKLGALDESQMRLAYCAADLFVHPAPVDNLPNVLLESMACGTPAVGFATGGIPEIITDAENGWLVTDITSEALGAGISRALTDISSDPRYWSLAARATVEDRFSAERQAETYLTIFESLADGSR